MNSLNMFREDGVFIFAVEVCRKLHRKLYNFFLSLKLKNGGGLDIAPSSFIRGVSHILVGKNFRSREHLRLEAVTAHKGISYDPRIVIKDNVEVNDYVHIGAAEKVEIGNNVLIASKVYISDHNHGGYSGSVHTDPSIAPIDRPLTKGKGVIIGDNVWIGESVSVLPGVKIGEGSVIGANSVVNRDIPPFSIAVGSPAVVIKKFDKASKKWISFNEGGR